MYAQSAETPMDSFPMQRSITATVCSLRGVDTTAVICSRLWERWGILSNWSCTTFAGREVGSFSNKSLHFEEQNTPLAMPAFRAGIGAIQQWHKSWQYQQPSMEHLWSNDGSVSLVSNLKRKEQEKHTICYSGPWQTVIAYCSWQCRLYRAVFYNIQPDYSSD